VACEIGVRVSACLDFLLTNFADKFNGHFNLFAVHLQYIYRAASFPRIREYTNWINNPLMD
jgi:hypothetical protein